MWKRPEKKKLSVLERRVPRNEKYAHVQGILNTGMTTTKLKVVSSSEYARRRDEIFFRITRRQLSELYGEYEQDEYESITDTKERIDGSPQIVTYREDERSSYNKPYLILDIREKFEYDKGHLLQARNFPYALLRRDQIPTDLYSFKNKEEHLIIVYCDDEKISREAAKTFVDRGVDNIFLLSGGMLEFAAEFPFYIEGEVPANLPKLPQRSGTLSILHECLRSLMSILLSGNIHCSFLYEFIHLFILPPCSLGTKQSSLGRIPENASVSPSQRGGGYSARGAPSSSPARSPSGRKYQTLSSFRKPPSSGRSYRGDDRSESGYSARSDVSVAESVMSRAMSRRGKF